jgi:lysophospholipase L1-like esterase
MKIAFLGDSLTEGWPGAAYLTLLQTCFSGDALLNRGRAGDTVQALLERMRGEGLQEVDLAFVWVGVNDVVMDTWGSDETGSGRDWAARLARLRDEYEELLSWAGERAPLLVCVRPLVLEAPGSLWETHAVEVGDAIAGLAAAVPGARALDLRPDFAAAAARGEGPFTLDGVHFTAAGAAVVAAAFATTIDEIKRGGPSAPGNGGRP